MRSVLGISLVIERTPNIIGPSHQISSQTSDHRIGFLSNLFVLACQHYVQWPHVSLSPTFVDWDVRTPIMSDPTTLKKRRGVAKASITRLTNRLKELESDTADKSIRLNLAQGKSCKLQTPDANFRMHHHALIDLIKTKRHLQWNKVC